MQMFPMSATQPQVEVTQTCPLCHTVDQMVTSDSPRRGAAWSCARCGQTWSPERLETVAAYMRYAAAH